MNVREVLRKHHYTFKVGNGHTVTVEHEPVNVYQDDILKNTLTLRCTCKVFKRPAECSHIKATLDKMSEMPEFAFHFS